MITSARSIRLGFGLTVLVTVSAAQVGIVTSEQKISDLAGGFAGDLDDFDYFGVSASGLGDIDGDGVPDVVIGAYFDDDGGIDAGAVWILLLETDGSVKAHRKISATSGGFQGSVDIGDSFGTAVAGLGDLDGNGVHDLAVGAIWDDDGGTNQGAVWILFLEADGTVLAHRKISATSGGFGGALDPSDQFGSSLAALGDLDDDGVVDLAVGALWDDDGGIDRGAVWILFLNADGSVKAEQKISDTAGGFDGAVGDHLRFGRAVAGPGDLDGDGIEDLAIGAPDLGLGGTLWICFLDADGTVRAEQEISATAGGFGGTLAAPDSFATSLAAIGDVDCDGVADLAVGAASDSLQGAVWIVLLERDGTVKAERKIGEAEGGFGGDLDQDDFFGASIAALGDLDGDGVGELGIGAYGDDDGGSFRGAAWILFLDGPTQITLDFETEDDLVTPLVDGQHLDVEFGVVATLSSSGPNAGLAVFDSTVGGPNDPSQDRDLLVDTGNVLILQTENDPPDADDVFPRPNDDEDGGTITFAFAVPMTAASVRLVDIDAGDGTTRVVLTDAVARRRTYTVPSDWTGDRLLSQPGHGRLDLTGLAPQPGFGSTATATEDAGFDPAAVVRLDVQLDGSGALDDLQLCTPSVPRARVITRNGSGVNRPRLSAPAPVIGRRWSTLLDCRDPQGGRATLLLRSRAAAGAPTPHGELLVGGTLLFRTTRSLAAPGVELTWDIPHDLSLCGLSVHAQALCSSQLRPGARVPLGRLSNALALVLGL